MQHIPLVRTWLTAVQRFHTRQTHRCSARPPPWCAETSSALHQSPGTAEEGQKDCHHCYCKPSYTHMLVHSGRAQHGSMRLALQTSQALQCKIRGAEGDIPTMGLLWSPHSVYCTHDDIKICDASYRPKVGFYCFNDVDGSAVA